MSCRGLYMIFVGCALLIMFSILPVGALQAQPLDSLQQEQTLSLSEAIQVALANNTEIKRSLLSLEDANAQVRRAWSNVLPDVSSSATYTRNLEVPVNFVPARFFDPEAPADELVPLQFGTDNTWQGGISVEQTLFSGESFVAISSSKVFKAAQAESLRATTQEIVTQTRLAYYNVLVAREQLRLQQATIRRLEENLKENQARYEAGLIDEYEVLQVQVQLKNQEPQRIQQEYAVDQAYRELKVILGVPLEISFALQGDLSTFNITARQAEEAKNKDLKQVDRMTPFQFADREAMFDLAFDLRGDIRVLETQTELQEREIRAIKSRFLPTLSANYSLNWNAAQSGTPTFFGTPETRARSQTLALTFSLPLFQGFERTANLTIAEIARKDLEEQQRAAKRSAKNEILSAREALQQARETAPARQEALDLAREGYERAQARLENGLGSQLDVSNAQLQLREAELNYAQMVYDYLAAKARYDQAVGLVPYVDGTPPMVNNY